MTIQSRRDRTSAKSCALSVAAGLIAYFALVGLLATATYGLSALNNSIEHNQKKLNKETSNASPN